MDKEDNNSILADDARVLRGGAFDGTPPVVRSAFRDDNRPSRRDSSYGLRVARTYR
jgi:formylglycine-generating enzyme required for sulfatase activity